MVIGPVPHVGLYDGLGPICRPDDYRVYVGHRYIHCHPDIRLESVLGRGQSSLPLLEVSE